MAGCTLNSIYKNNNLIYRHVISRIFSNFQASVTRKLSSKMTNEFKERKKTPLKHLFDGTDFNPYERNYINLSAGTPSEGLLSKCNEIFAKSTEHLLNYERANKSYIFQYGPTTGTYQFRVKLAEFLSRNYQSPVNSADLILTCGASSGMLLILSSLMDLNGVVFVDEVTYMIALEAIREFPSLKIVSVKLNEDGVDVNDLEQKIIKYNESPKFGKMFHSCYYTIPTYHNPTGILFSDEICKALIKLARKYEILIACDDVYNMLYYDDDLPPKRLFEYDCDTDVDFKGNIISNGTFSKILSPGVRIGWIECAPRITQVLKNNGFLKSGGGINNYTSGIIASMIELGLADEQLKECSQHYKAQRDALIQVLNEFLPRECSFIRPRGGYFVWIKLPQSCNGEILSEYILEKKKVNVIKGNRFSCTNESKNFIRVSFAFHSPATIEKAAMNLCDGIREFLMLE